MAEDSPEPAARRPPARRRLSLTKADRATTAGLELLILLQDIADDGRVEADEVARLREWLRASLVSDLPAHAYLATVIADVERDGHVTDDELTLVHDVILRVLPPEFRDLARLRRRELRLAAAAERAAQQTAARTAKSEQRQRDRVLERADFMIAGALREEARREACEILDVGDKVWLVREGGCPDSC